jgi:hypothetical protein
VLSGACGHVRAKLVYQPPPDTSETTPVRANTHTGTVADYPERNVVLLGGCVFCDGVSSGQPKNRPGCTFGGTAVGAVDL